MHSHPGPASPSDVPTPQRPALALAEAMRRSRRAPAFSLVGFIVSLGAQLAAILALPLLRLLLSNRIGLRQDTAEFIGVAAAVAIAFAGGWIVATLTRRIGFWELFLGLVAVVGGGYALVALSPERALEAFSLVPEGGLPFAPLLHGGGVFLAAAIASTLGTMLGAGTRLDLSFGYERYVAKSHLRLSKPLLVSLSLLTLGIVPGVVAVWLHLRKQKRSPTLIMTVLSIGGVAVGVMALCVVLSVMSGFEADLKEKILGTNAHAVVLKYGTFDDWKEAADKAKETPGVVGVTPFVISEVMVTSESVPAGAVIKGIDPKTVGEVTDLPREIQEGRLEYLDEPEKIPLTPQFRNLDIGGADDLRKELEKLAQQGKSEAPVAKNELPGIVIGRELARNLRVYVGDTLTVVSPVGGELGPMGPQPKNMQFRVAAVFYSGMYEYDAKFVYISLERAQAFFKMGKGVSGLELKTSNVDDARRISRSVLAELEGYPYRVRDWGEMNRNLFSALKLEKIVMAVILAFIVLVACFNILSTLVMLVLEKGKEISILKSMGARDSSIMKIFVLEGVAIGGIGTALGLTLGVILCAVIAVFPIPLDPEVYYIPHLPVQLDPLQFVFVAAAAVVLAYLATIFPALYASRMAPVEGLKND